MPLTPAPQSPPDPVIYDFVKIAAAAIVSAALSALLSGVWIRNWQFREDFIERRANDLIDHVNRSADLACKYWQRGEKKPTRADDDSFEAELISLQLTIASLRCLFADLLPQSHPRELQNRESNLFMALTGGEFGSSDRRYESTRLREIRHCAAQYCAEVRSALRARMDSRWWRKVRS